MDSSAVGDGKRASASSFYESIFDILEIQGELNDLSEGKISEDRPNVLAEQYAKTHDMTLEEAIEYLKEIYGDPQ